MPDAISGGFLRNIRKICPEENRQIWWFSDQGSNTTFRGPLLHPLIMILFECRPGLQQSVKGNIWCASTCLYLIQPICYDIIWVRTWSAAICWLQDNLLYTNPIFQARISSSSIPAGLGHPHSMSHPPSSSIIHKFNIENMNFII